MRILLDQNTPAPLRYALLGHQVETAYERGWSELSNTSPAAPLGRHLEGYRIGLYSICRESGG
jgi:hypothetical protein